MDERGKKEEVRCKMLLSEHESYGFTRVNLISRSMYHAGQELEN